MAALAVLALAACGENPGPSWNMNSRPVVAGDSLTIQRVAGTATEVPPLRTEPGDVWPVQEAPRGTLGNPDQALSGLPEPQRLGDARLPPSPPPRPRGSSTPPPAPELPPRLPPAASVAPIPPPPSVPREDGRIIPVPGEPSAQITGSTPNYQTYSVPGQPGAGGVAIPQGSTTTLIGPDGRIRVVPTPR
jgi:hypothetical protein